MNPFFIVLAVLTFGLLSLSSAQNAADLFKSGRIRLAEEVRLSADFPAGLRLNP
ncbi:MAG: hypothetical protein Q8O91_11235 [Candidatus Aminicenantes bacterium]|nr:hypothetical protein [Candidatus Aminicenantes bacterium]